MPTSQSVKSLATATPEEKLETKMAEVRLKALEQEAESEAAAAGVPYVNLFRFPISPEAIALVPEERAKEIRAVCFLYNGSDFRVGARSPADAAVTELVHEIEERTHAKGAVYLISERSLGEAMKFYAMLPKYRPISKGVAITEQDLAKYKDATTTFEKLNEELKKVNVTDIITLLIAASLGAESSDLHVEAEEEGITARLRLDGILQDVATMRKDLWPKVISRVKLVSGLKINITDKPQDGRFTIETKAAKIDVRVSTLPTVWGESVVMRFLNPAIASVSFDDLGIRGKAFAELQKQIARPSGMIITTGPTGSGKTTTMYAVLSKLNEPGVKIITLEDPVEYKLEGVSQSQIDPSKDYTFAKGLRSILRQDPDIVLVGEIRDLETAEIAIQAALTGHLMLSTIHTNSAAGAIPRFLSMGVKPFLLAPALNAVIGQRLVRKLCQSCKKSAVPDEATLARIKEILQNISADEGAPADWSKVIFYGPGGCPLCRGLGYKGRLGLYEIFTMSKEIEQVILSANVSEYAMQEIAVKQGMVTMAQDGLLKAIDGITSVEEVFRVAEEK